MSFEEMEAFVEQVFTDADLRGQIMGAADREEWLIIARQAGFAFSTGEYAEVLNRLAGRAMRLEMGEDQPRRVPDRINGSGGSGNRARGKSSRRTIRAP
jgi:predicted ribosomally synthesized peptide with nif11-like leader